MPSKNNNRRSSKSKSKRNRSHDRGRDIKNQPGASKLLQTARESKFVPITQYPVDDAMPVKSWVFEKWPVGQGQYKPLRPEDERKAIEVLNRHLPFWDQIEIIQENNAGTEEAIDSRPRHYPETHLPLPPRCWDCRDRERAATPPGSPKPAKKTRRADFLAKRLVRVRSMNFTETEDKEEEAAERAELESFGPVPVVPDLVLTRPDGEARRLQDPNVYIR